MKYDPTQHGRNSGTLTVEVRASAPDQPGSAEVGAHCASLNNGLRKFREFIDQVEQKYANQHLAPERRDGT